MPDTIQEIQDRITKFVGRRNSMIADLNAQLEAQVSDAQAALLKDLVAQVSDELQTEKGKIANTAYNRRLLSSIDAVFDNFASGDGLDIVKSMIAAGTTIIAFNNDYFSIFGKPAELIPLKKQVIGDLRIWLGIDGDDKLKQNGYLNTLITNDRMRDEVKQFTLKGIQTQEGFFGFKKNLNDYFFGEDPKGGTGRLQRYYRNYAYDTYSQIDRTASTQFAEGLGMTYALYEGGLIAGSRPFCIKHNGKVFTKDEILKFDPKEAKPPNYNPMVDLGGYACRHHLNWISYELAVLYRPDLKKE